MSALLAFGVLDARDHLNGQLVPDCPDERRVEDLNDDQYADFFEAWSRANPERAARLEQLVSKGKARSGPRRRARRV